MGNQPPIPCGPDRGAGTLPAVFDRIHDVARGDLEELLRGFFEQ